MMVGALSHATIFGHVTSNVSIIYHSFQTLMAGYRHCPEDLRQEVRVRGQDARLETLHRGPQCAEAVETKNAGLLPDSLVHQSWY